MDNRQTSEWNGAADYLARINMILTEAAMASMELNLYKWLHSLKLFYREISSVMKKEEREQLYNESIELSTKINQYLSKKSNPLMKSRIGADWKLIEALEQFEIKLRAIYKESGLQMRLMEDASRALR